MFQDYDLSACPTILAFLRRIGSRPTNIRAKLKGDPGLVPILGAKLPGKA